MLHFFKKNNEKHLQISLSKSWWYDLQLLRYRAKHTEIGNFRSFFALLPPKNPKNQNFEKWKNLLEISSFYTCVPKITIIWYTVPEIRTKIFCHFGPFFAHLPQWSWISKFWKKWKKWLEILSFYTYMCTINEDHIWFWKYKMQQTDIFNILGHFLPFQHLDNLENQKFNIGKNHLHHKWQSYDVWSLR